jgi:hypothetical protein
VADKPEKKKVTLERLRRERELNDIRSLCGRKEGRRFFWRIFKRAHIYETTFTGDALSGAFKEGERNLGLFVLADLMEAAPDRLLEMSREAEADAKKEADTEKEVLDDDSPE